MVFWKKESYKNNGETQEEEGLEIMNENDIIRLSDLESIADKVRELPREFDIQAYDINFTEKEQRIISAFEMVGKISLFNEFKHLKDKIRNHHHVVLSVDDGIKFRENGNRVQRPGAPAAGMGTAR